MRLEDMPLARQIDHVFRQLETELTDAVAGTVTIQIRNNMIGKYGVRHHPIECINGRFLEKERGLTVQQVNEFRRMAVESLRMKRNWTHGEILFDFAVRRNREWTASVQYESNYNTANWMFRYQPKPSESSNQLA
ncbi:MAG: O-methyltransferase [Thermobacillus sp.]|uniref:O-methyltransferase n=1 Tax=Thermobacillus sp. TaxID=2108467 RepID=UPI000E364378|nr:O-methyltransferase [Thermobacillus sp.]REK56526.1 MAG: O-methyltransferase [Thermobacillus sp.]